MGFYIEVPNVKNKAQQLVNLYSGEIIEKPKQFADVPKDRGLICVTVNNYFDAAGFCYSEKEFKVFSNEDGRVKHWVLLELELAKKLSGYAY
jgi:hypothetical protein